MPQRGVRPEDALGCDALAGLTEVHGDRRAEEILDLITVGVRSNPARPSYRYTAQDEGRQMEQGNAVEVCGEKADDVLLETDEDDARDGAFELRDGRDCLCDVSVGVWAWVPVVFVVMGVVMMVCMA